MEKLRDKTSEIVNHEYVYRLLYIKVARGHSGTFSFNKSKLLISAFTISIVSKAIHFFSPRIPVFDNFNGIPAD